MPTFTTEKEHDPAATSATIAKELQVHPDTVRRWIRRGARVGSQVVKLSPVEVIGSRLVIRRSTLASFLARCKAAKLGPEQQAATESDVAKIKRCKAAKQRVAKLLD